MQVFVDLLLLLVLQGAFQHLHLQVEEGEGLGDAVVQALGNEVALLQYSQLAALINQAQVAHHHAELAAQGFPQFGIGHGHGLFLFEIERNHAEILRFILDFENAQLLEAHAAAFAVVGVEGVAVGFTHELDGLPVVVYHGVAAQAVVEALAGFGGLQAVGQVDLAH